jgi:uncharacterized membrane protein YvbJ
MQNMRQCPHCGQTIGDVQVCPNCGAKIRPQLGRLTESEIRRIRKPISIIMWGIVIVFLILRATGVF